MLHARVAAGIAMLHFLFAARLASETLQEEVKNFFNEGKEKIKKKKKSRLYERDEIKPLEPMQAVVVASSAHIHVSAKGIPKSGPRCQG